MLRCFRGIGCEVVEFRVTVAGLYGHDSGLSGSVKPGNFYSKLWTWKFVKMNF
jgi:hypothetical protein